MSSQEAFTHDTRAPRVARRRAPVTRGEVLLYRPRSNRAETPPESSAHQHTTAIHHGGREFFATPEMAQCFLAKARRVLEAHDAELVALLHKDGLDMLYIAQNIPFSVGSMFDHQPCVSRNVTA